MHFDRSWHFVFYKNIRVGKRDLLSCHISLCLGKQLGSWKREIQWSSAVFERLNEHKPVCLLIVLLLLLLRWQLLFCVFVPLCSTWPLCSVLSQGLCCYLGLRIWVCPSFLLSCSYFLSYVLSLPFSANPLCFSFQSWKVCQSFPWWLKPDVGVLKCSKWNNLEVVTSITYQHIICRGFLGDPQR